MCIIISKVGDMDQSVQNGDPNMTIDISNFLPDPKHMIGAYPQAFVSSAPTVRLSEDGRLYSRLILSLKLPASFAKIVTQNEGLYPKLY